MILRAMTSPAALAAITLISVNNLGIFAFSSWRIRNVPMTVLKMNAALDPIESERAQAMSEYLVKSHEEKLKAVKEAEEKKENEIQGLRDEIETLKTSQKDTAVLQHTGIVPAEGSVEDLTTKLAAYQKFMADYVVRAQEQKLLSVKNAEAAIKKKYEEKFLLLGKASQPVAETPKIEGKASPAPSPAKEVQNTVNIPDKPAVEKKASKPAVEKKAAKAKPVAEKKAAVDGPKTVTSILNDIPKEVIEADHGLRADGGVVGPTLAERVMNGANLGTDNSPAANGEEKDDVFKKRNKHIVNAGKAGKSRWGEREIERCAELVIDLKAGEIGAAP
mmetsp:Transcript_61982/g.72490  ORF Transcript_61982/g.72490 Transcript_61982/m.72490 type:complete len:333 (+) Transcript_61982:136-1134(+)